MVYSKYPYKDSLPKDTVKKIIDILVENDISLIENWLSIDDGLCVVDLLLDSKKVSSGKGLTKEYALASAYSEFMERLQNDFVVNFLFNVPDEQTYSIDEFLRQETVYVYKTLSYYLNPDEREPNFEKGKIQLERILDIFKKKDIRVVPFYSLKEEKEVFLPVDITTLVHLTTGMCAGNTPEEALVQGLCEILERYAGYEVIRSRILPPLIPKEDYLKFPKVKSNVEFYKSKGYEIEFRDCSFQKDLPVLLMVVYNKKQNSYTTTFSSHPCFEIALQRCFTEHRQEKDDLSLSGRELFYHIDNEVKDYNVEAELRRNLLESIIHLNFDENTNRAGFVYNSEIWCKTFASNKEMLDYLIKIVLKISDNIYFRDVSFLGYNAFSIIVPELSFSIISEEVFASMYNRQRFKSVLQNWNIQNYSSEPLTASETYSCFDWNVKTDYLTQRSTILYGVDDFEFLVAYSYINGDYQRMMKYLDKYIEKGFIESKTFSKKIASVLKVYIESKLNGLEENMILNNLTQLFHEEIIEYIKKYWIDSDPFYNCFRKHSIVYNCVNENNEKYKFVIKKLEEKYKNSIPSQIDLKKIFVSYNAKK